MIFKKGKRKCRNSFISKQARITTKKLLMIAMMSFLIMNITMWEKYMQFIEFKILLSMSTQAIYNLSTI